MMGQSDEGKSVSGSFFREAAQGASRQTKEAAVVPELKEEEAQASVEPSVLTAKRS